MVYPGLPGAFPICGATKLDLKPGMLLSYRWKVDSIVLTEISENADLCTPGNYKNKKKKKKKKNRHISRRAPAVE